MKCWQNISKSLDFKQTFQLFKPIWIYMPHIFKIAIHFKCIRTLRKPGLDNRSQWRNLFSTPMSDCLSWVTQQGETLLQTHITRRMHFVTILLFFYSNLESLAELCMGLQEAERPALICSQTLLSEIKQKQCGDWHLHGTKQFEPKKCGANKYTNKKCRLKKYLRYICIISTPWYQGEIQVSWSRLKFSQMVRHDSFCPITHVRIKGQNLNFYLETHATTHNFCLIRLRILPRNIILACGWPLSKKLESLI